MTEDRIAAAIVTVVGLVLWLTFWWSFYKIIEDGFKDEFR